MKTATKEEIERLTVAAEALNKVQNDVRKLRAELEAEGILNTRLRMKRKVKK